MQYFNYEKTAQEAGLTADQLSRLGDLVRGDYPDDDMLRELHMLRACRALRDKVYTFDEMISGRPALRETGNAAR